MDEQAFRQWYAEMARRYDLDPSPEGQFYDYRAAFKAGAEPGPDGHWPSAFKLEGHPNEVVGGFNTRTGARVPGTRQASADELVEKGWDQSAADKFSRETASHFDLRGILGRTGAPMSGDLGSETQRLLQELMGARQ